MLCLETLKCIFTSFLVLANEYQSDGINNRIYLTMSMTLQKGCSINRSITWITTTYLPIFQCLKSPKKLSEMVNYFSSPFWHDVVAKQKKNRKEITDNTISTQTIFGSILSRILNSESQFFEFLLNRNKK